MGIRVRSGFAGLLVSLVAWSAGAAGFDWTPFTEASVIEILTRDDDDALRETKVWVVVSEGAGYIRTNDSRWLANIERDRDFEIRAAGATVPMRAEVVQDALTQARVEDAFRQKYGFVQRIMSTFRFREPTVLRLLPRIGADAG